MKFWLKSFWREILWLLIIFGYSFAAEGSGSGGTVVAWGYGGDGETNVPSGLTNVIAIASGGWHGMALNANSTVVDWGLETGPALTNVVAIAAGADPNGLALLNNGTLVSWGGNDDGVSAIPPGLNNVVAIAAGYGHSVAVKSDGTVVAWGDNSSGQTNVPPGLSNVVAVSAGEFHSLALKNDGTVVGWGDNFDGESVPPAGLSNVVAIAAGVDYYSIALKSDGTVQCWGFAVNGQTSPPGGLSNVVAIAAGGEYGLALKNDGTIVPWGYSAFGGTNIPAGMSNVMAIAAYVDLSMAIVSDGSPHVTRQPFSQTTYSGSPVALSVGAVGKPPLSYQWQFNGTNISSATKTALNLSGVQLGDSGLYSVLVSNAQGGTGSSNAILTVINSLPIISIQPTNQTCALGLIASFSVTAVGSMPLSYQWQFNASNIVGATGASLFLTNVQSADQGNYRVVVTNAYGSVTGSNVALTTPPFVFASVPVNQSVPSGNNVNFSVSPSAASPIAYQWQFNSANISGATNASLSLKDVQSGNTGMYTILVSNLYGMTNLSATLTVNSAGPTVTFNTNSQTTIVGGFANFQATVQGSEPLNYQWQFNNTNIDGATNNLLSLTNVQQTNQGNYRVVVTNLYGQAISSNAFLTVTLLNLGQALNATNLTWTLSGNSSWYPETTLTHDGLAAQSGPVRAGQVSSLQTTVTGPATVTFWWYDSTFNPLVFYVNGSFQGQSSRIPGWSLGGPFYLGAGTQNLDWNYIGFVGQSGSGTAYLDQISITSGGTAAAISKSPTSQTVRAGTNVTLQVNAFGTPPLAYQWQFNSNNLAGATGLALTLTNVQSANAGVYNVIVTNAYGVAPSSNATLVVQQPYFGTSPGNSSFTSQGFALQLSGLTGHGIVTIYSSTNMANWTPIFTNPPVTGSLQFLDSNALNVPFQFYRATEQ
ncbi:MAG TPA: immunoglobulin domain-containing protein [Verrucomicrobiae bacterium]|nr:immunoglobulin domain-containing protein [Verrucomicrobiae bacterium]